MPRSACADAQADLSIGCSPRGCEDTIESIYKKAKTLRLSGDSDLSGLSLFADACKGSFYLTVLNMRIC